MAASRKRLSNKPVVGVVADSLCRHVTPHARLVLALSGGIDSVVLLHVLCSLRGQFSFELRAVHIHHGLSPDADDWADFCAAICESHAVECLVHRVRIPDADPAGIEAAARRERQHLYSTLDADFVLTAHQQNDQAETLLLQMLRGAGPKGLAAMAEVQRPPGWRAAHLRPLLESTRADLEGYASTHKLTWVEDSSNQNVRFRRNALRQQVMPLLQAHFPGATLTLARAAALQADATGLLDDLARLDATDAIAGDRLDCAALDALSLPRARNLLRYFIESWGQPMPSARRLNEALRQIAEARRDAALCIKLGAVSLVRFRGGVFLVPSAPARSEPVRWRGEAQLFVPAAGVAVQLDAVVGAGLRRAALESAVVTLGVRQGGERLRLHARGPRRSLKKLMQEHALPPWQRERLPLLWCDGQLRWAAGIGLDVDALAAPGEAGLLPRVAADD
jgi:tRNA(Ile)-lysidine synthase